MKIKIVAVGKIKEQYWRDAIAEYVKRLRRFCTVEIAETEECFSNGTQTAGEVERVKKAEGEAVLNKLEGYVVAMDMSGVLVSSEKLSEIISERKQYGSGITFVIGGSNGLSDVVKNRADLILSFGKVTLPHQLFRVVLCEQIYRAFCIENNIRYHK